MWEQQGPARWVSETGLAERNHPYESGCLPQAPCTQSPVSWIWAKAASAPQGADSGVTHHCFCESSLQRKEHNNETAGRALGPGCLMATLSHLPVSAVRGGEPCPKLQGAARLPALLGTQLTLFPPGWQFPLSMLLQAGLWPPGPVLFLLPSLPPTCRTLSSLPGLPGSSSCERDSF